MELILSAVMVFMMGQQTAAGIHHNAKFMFSTESDGSIIVMNTQDGSMYRCSKELVCDKKKEPND